MDLKKHIRSIPDYPKKGILFRDITTLIKNAEAFKFTNDKIIEISKKFEFDKVAAMYVISVTHNPRKLIDEMKRVCKCDGDIFIVNHFSCDSDNLLVRTFEKALMPVSKLLGWKPYFPYAEFDSYANLDVLEISKVNIFDYWNIIHASNNK